MAGLEPLFEAAKRDTAHALEHLALVRPFDITFTRTGPTTFRITCICAGPEGDSGSVNVTRAVEIRSNAPRIRRGMHVQRRHLSNMRGRRVLPLQSVSVSGDTVAWVEPKRLSVPALFQRCKKSGATDADRFDPAAIAEALASIQKAPLGAVGTDEAFLHIYNDGDALFVETSNA